MGNEKIVIDDVVMRFKIALTIALLLSCVFGAKAQVSHFDTSGLKYNLLPQLERVYINGRWCYVETWELLPGQYVSYRFDGRNFDAQHMPVYSTIQDTTVNDVVTRVHDGDSPYLIGMADFARIAGIDAPEIYWGNGTKDQEFGRASGDSLRFLLKGKRVSYDFLGLDNYGRPLVSLYLEDGTDVAEYSLLHGWAWAYGSRKLPKATNSRYKAAQAKAKKEKKGLWKSKDPVKPWVHRGVYPRVK